MANQEILRKTVADYCQVPVELVGRSFPLTGSRLQSSVARHVLDSAIRRELGVRCPTVFSAKTFGELLDGLTEGSSRHGNSERKTLAQVVPTDDVRSRQPALEPVLSCGIDLESIDLLPVASDYWEHEFYRTNFTDAEIAYCVSQAEPAIHFAARWCAKEALKKCMPGYLREEMRRIEVSRDGEGRPFLQFVRGQSVQRVSAVLSMTHSTREALAIVISAPHLETATGDIPLRPNAVSTRMPEPGDGAPLPQGSSTTRDGRGLVPMALSLISVVLAIIALVRSF